MIATQACTFPSKISFKENIFGSALQIVGASLLICLCTQIRIPLFFTPIPFSCQTLAVLLIGTTLGSRKGVLSVLLYLFEGTVLGLPVFVGGAGSFGFQYFLGPTGGYLIGFAVQAFLAGKFMERQTNFHSAKTASAMLCCCFLQLGIGVLWLAHFVGWNQVMLMGFYPFIPSEIIKSIAVTRYLKSHYKPNLRNLGFKRNHFS